MTTPSVLGLRSATTGWQDAGAGRGQPTQRLRTFEDWTIDGDDLRGLLATSPLQEMTPLCEMWPWPKSAVAHLETLLGERAGDFDDGRVALLRCLIDNDLGCGALSMSLHITDVVVSWNDLGWQVNYEPYDPNEDRLSPPRGFTFDRQQYEVVIRAALLRYRGLAEQQAGARPSPPARRWWQRR
jgi:hypothetical protein